MQWVTHDGAWLRSRRVRIENFPGVGEVLRFEAPWQPYELAIGEEGLVSIGGRRAQRLEPLSMRFASLETPEDYRAFAEEWGPLGEEMVIKHPPEVEPFLFAGTGADEAVDSAGNVHRFLRFRAVQKDLRGNTMLSLVEEAVGKAPSVIRANIGEWVGAGGVARDRYIIAGPDSFEVPFDAREPVLAWSLYADEVRAILTGEAPAGRKARPRDLWLEMLLEKVRVRPVQAGERWTFSWAFTSLLSAIALDALLWLSKGEPIRQCIRPGCSRLFIPHHPDARYCSDVCRRAVQNARVNEARRLAWRTAQEIAAQGVVGRELVRQVTARLNERFDVERDEATVARWLRKAAEKKGANPDARS